MNRIWDRITNNDFYMLKHQTKPNEYLDYCFHRHWCTPNV